MNLCACALVQDILTCLEKAINSGHASSTATTVAKEIGYALLEDCDVTVNGTSLCERNLNGEILRFHMRRGPIVAHQASPAVPAVDRVPGVTW